ncbi:MAG: recombination-associated protein RdgC [Xanthomonadaceae bacterium]|nr:recombination-associated protein RdgC [Xanthomonadaceae bacterium]
MTWFRNLTLFRFSEKTAKSLKTLEDKLDKQRLRAPGPIEMATRGFISPFGRHEEMLTHRVGGFILLNVANEHRLLPNSVISEELAARLKKIAEKEGRKIGSKERKRLKDEILTDLLPRAFTKMSRTGCYLSTKSGFVVLDTASRKSAEEAVSLLREALGSFPAVPMAPEESPRRQMTDWLIHGKLPTGLVLGDECELRDPAESGAVVRCRRQDLETDEVREHLKSGKQAFALGLTFEDRVSFTLGEDLAVRKLRFLDVVQDEREASGRDAEAGDLDATFALMTLELERLLQKLDEWFGLPRPDDRDQA